MRSDSALITELVCQPWLIPAAMHRELTAKFRSLVAAENKPDDTPEYTINGNGVAAIQVHGVMWQGWSSKLYDPHAGVTSTDILAKVVTRAANDPAVSAIVLHIDSPGGLSTGIPEASKAILAARQIKPVVAYNAAMMDSAAYWLGAQASIIWATESARTGSVGAYLALLDVSGFYADMGIKLELFKSGENKGMGIPGTSLTDAQRDRLQARIDKLGAKFRASVTSARAGLVPVSYMDGDDYDSDEALAGGLIDGVGTLDEALAVLSRVQNKLGHEGDTV